MKKVFGILLSAAMMLSLATTALAAEKMAGTMEVLGGIEDQTGILLPDAAEIADWAQPDAAPNYGTRIFSMSAQGVTDLITTRGNPAKTVYKGDISNDSIFVRGTVTCTGTNHPVTEIRVGLCYYDSRYQKFSTDPAWFGCFSNGSVSQKRILTASLDPRKPYYGFIKNATGSGVPNGGWVSGTVSFYDSPRVIDPGIQ